MGTRPVGRADEEVLLVGPILLSAMTPAGTADPADYSSVHKSCHAEPQRGISAFATADHETEVPRASGRHIVCTTL